MFHVKRVDDPDTPSPSVVGVEDSVLGNTTLAGLSRAVLRFPIVAQRVLRGAFGDASRDPGSSAFRQRGIPELVENGDAWYTPPASCMLAS